MRWSRVRFGGYGRLGEEGLMGDEGLWGGCVVLLGPGRDEGPQGGVGREDPVISVPVDARWGKESGDERM